MSNKKEIIDIISEDTGFSKKDTEIFIGSFLKSIENVLENNDKISFSGFGTFETKKRASRTVLVKPGHPEEGKKTIPESLAPTFKFSKSIKDKIKK